MRRLGADLRVYSLWGGGGDFHGLRVRAFPKWRLLELLWLVPWFAGARWDVFGVLLRGLITRRAPSWLNFWENLLGAGFAAVFARQFRKNPPHLVHAAWSGAPATAAWCLARLDRRLRFSAAAHAYDLFEHGGDWWLVEKLAGARFVHTSTDMGAATLRERGVAAEKIHVIRRGLDAFPDWKPLRAGRSPLRIVCVARLVEKKGLDRQLRIYAALRHRGLAFEARVLGGGPLRAPLTRLARELGVQTCVTFCGSQPQTEVWAQLAWADVLVHTGVIASSGDRDGLPNVIPEAMAAGVNVVTSPTAATTEAIRDGETGLVRDVADVAAWAEAVRALASDDALAERLRTNARRWTEGNFDAHQNAARLHAQFLQAIKS